MGLDQRLHLVAAAREASRHHETLSDERLRGQLARCGLELQSGHPQAADDVEVGRVGEVFEDGVGDAFPDLVGLDQLLARGVHHGVERAEVLGQVFRRGFAHEADAQSEQHAREGNLLRAFDRADDVLGRLLAQPGQRRELFGPQVVEIGDGAHQGVVVEQLDGLLAQTLDVEGLAADEVDDASDDLGTASALVRTVVLGFALVTHQFGAAFGAVRNVFEGTAVGGTLRELHARNLGDDLAALLDIDHVARADVQQGHLLGVVERGATYGGPGQQHGREVRDGGDGSGASDLERDAFQTGQHLLGLELVGHGPFRGFGRESQLPAHGEVVDLDDDAVGREG